MFGKRVRVLAAAAMMGALGSGAVAACSDGGGGTDPGPGPGPNTTRTIQASATSFSPAAVTIPAGGVVNFQWGNGSHTVTPENPSGSWTEHALASAADNFSVTFNTPGTYRFRCRPHSSDFTTGMVGVITVQ